MATLEEMVRAVNLVRDDAMSIRQAAKICGVSRETVRRWKHMLEGDVSGLYGFVARQKAEEGKPMVELDNLPDDPEELKRIIFDLQFELDLKEAVVDMLKKDPGVHPRKLKNKEKACLVDALATKKTYSIGWMTSYLQLAPATFYYQRKRIGKDAEAALRAKVIKVSLEHPEFGYRRVKRFIDNKDEGFPKISEKRVRRIMKQEGIQPSRRRKDSRYSSYDRRKDNGEAPPDIPLKEDGTHDFTACAPNTLWVSDVTEFRLPSEDRVFLSPVLDCFDSSLVGWRISTSEKAEDLTNPSLMEAAGRLRVGDRCVAHTDRGGQYFSAGWIEVCKRFDITRSMSRKGHSPDNARMEGFFGRLKMEFFDTRNWEGTDTDAFIARLNEWLCYYNEKRLKESLGWLSPMQYRRRYLDAA